MRLVPRSAWGAAYGIGSRIAGAVQLVVIHHTAGANLAPDVDEETERQIVRAIEKDHVENPKKRWRGIGYNFLVFPSGRVYEGRGWRQEGAHTEGKNDESVGIAFATNAEIHQPTPPAMQSVRDLIVQGLLAKHIAEPFEIKGHRDYASTECPGDLLYARLWELRPPEMSLDPKKVTREALAEIERQIALIKATL